MLFGALAAEPAGIKATVQEAINSMAGAYAGVTGPAADQLRALLTSSLASRYDSVRLCAITWAQQVYAFDDPYARHLCLVGAADSKHEVRGPPVGVLWVYSVCFAFAQSDAA